MRGTETTGSQPIEFITCAWPKVKACRSTLPTETLAGGLAIEGVLPDLHQSTKSGPKRQLETCGSWLFPRLCHMRACAKELSSTMPGCSAFCRSFCSHCLNMDTGADAWQWTTLGPLKTYVTFILSTCRSWCWGVCTANKLRGVFQLGVCNPITYPLLGGYCWSVLDQFGPVVPEGKTT